jgi:hypothetical protein
MSPSMGTLKYGHIRQVVSDYSFNKYAMLCEGPLKPRLQNTSYCLVEVVTKPCFTVINVKLTFSLIPNLGHEH